MTLQDYISRDFVTLSNEVRHCIESPCQLWQPSPCVREYVKYIFQVMLQDHIIRDSSDFMGGGWFGGHKHCDKVDISFLIYHVTSRDHVLKVLSNFVGKLLLLSRHLAKRYNRSNISRRKATQ